jgi:O-acetylserine/cysteine efflux transporter
VDSRLSLRDAVLALAVVAIWGSNFVVVKIALAALPPLLLAGLRFLIVLVPAAFFLPKPKVSWANLAVYGFAIGGIQFGLMFFAMNGHISPGLASLVVQMQVFFTVGLSVLRPLDGGRERIARHQLAAFALALAGMGVIAAHNGRGVTILGLCLTIVAGMGWAIANQAAREATRQGPVNMLAYVVWASLFAVPPLLLMSLLLEGWPAIRYGVTHAGWAIWATLIWQSAGNTMFGYAVWNWLLSRYPASTIAPLSLLVPVFGMASSAWWLGEPLQDWKIAASALVMAGLAVNLFWPKKKQTPALAPR